MKNLTTTGQMARKNYLITVSGEQGVGKTSFGAEWPSPIFLAIEDGLLSIADRNLPVVGCDTTDELIDAFRSLHADNHDFRTVVIDSMTALEAMIIEKMLADERSKSLAHLGGGYGAGYRMLEAKMQKLVGMAEHLLSKMHVIMICQSEIESFSPEDAEPYDRLTVRIDKRCKRLVIDKPDAVVFIREKKDVQKTSGSHIAIGTGERELLCHKCPSAVSKNRLGITEVLDLPPGTNPLLDPEQRQATADNFPGSQF